MLGYIAGGIAAAAAASLAGLHTMAPWSQLYGANFNGLEKGTKKLCLTYDDGPNDPYTPELLDVLAKHGVKATFFMVGQFVEQRPNIARSVVEAGHDVGNHTWSHPNLIFTPPADLERQLTRTQKAIADATGITPELFRPPFGGRRPGTIQAARRLGMTAVMWRVTCFDWSATSHESILQKADRQITGGDVILLHDGGHLALGTNRSHTVRATDLLIRKYRELGYEFVPVSEMLADSVVR